MTDDELMHVALTASLMPEAEAELREVLRERGISDLSMQRADLSENLRAIDLDRNRRLGRSRKSLRNGVLFGCAGGLLLIAHGLYTITLNDPKVGPGDGALSIAAGVVCLVITLVIGAVWLFLLRNVLFRRSPARMRPGP
ncbi:hypothetical protein ACXU4B_10810 [Dyella soli]|uniref:DUF2335 domain-containing protein n=1 Tax=Dyella soli TaxID=522319 RepID=A0A4R0YJC9_9GAMM|nr:hypothetical protein [Dyella soli]TCI07332.1 hypothetical protein EZM97_32610 [Dyella soli]